MDHFLYRDGALYTEDVPVAYTLDGSKLVGSQETCKEFMCVDSVGHVSTSEIVSDGFWRLCIKCADGLKVLG